VGVDHGLPGPILPSPLHPDGPRHGLLDSGVDIMEAEHAVEPPSEIVSQLVLEPGPDLAGARLIGQWREETEVHNDGVRALSTHATEQIEHTIVADSAHQPVPLLDELTAGHRWVEDVLKGDVVDSAVDQCDV